MWRWETRGAGTSIPETGLTGQNTWQLTGQSVRRRTAVARDQHPETRGRARRHADAPLVSGHWMLATGHFRDRRTVAALLLEDPSPLLLANGLVPRRHVRRHERDEDRD